MKEKNLLAVPELDAFMETYKEEIAHEFGIHRTILELDTTSKDMTKLLMEKNKSEEKEEEDEKNEGKKRI